MSIKISLDKEQIKYILMWLKYAKAKIIKIADSTEANSIAYDNLRDLIYKFEAAGHEEFDCGKIENNEPPLCLECGVDVEKVNPIFPYCSKKCKDTCMEKYWVNSLFEDDI